MLSTWQHGLDANKAAWAVLEQKGSALDAVESGVRVTESDPRAKVWDWAVFLTGRASVTLDACIMDHESNCGAVAFLQNIENPFLSPAG